MIKLIAFLFPVMAMASTVKTEKLCLREGTNDSCITITGTSTDGNFTLDPDGGANQVLTNDGSGNWTWENSAAGFTNPMDSAGDLIYGGASGVATKLDSGTAGQLLVSGGAAAPVWTNKEFETGGGGGETKVTGSALVLCSTSSSITTNDVSMVSAIGNRSGTTCNVTIAGSFFSGSPECMVSNQNNGTPRIVGATVNSATSVDIHGYDGSVGVNATVQLHCWEWQ